MRLGVVVVALIAVAVLVPGLGRSPGFDPRETRDLFVARELIRTGTPGSPAIGGVPLFEKPLLAYAPDVAATLLTHRPLAVSRVWRIVIAGLIVLVTGSLGARHLGPRAGLAAAAVLATSLALPLASRVDGTQLLGTLLAWIALDGLTDARFGRRPGRTARLMMSYVALAAAALCCGPLPAVWPLLGVQIYAMLAKPSDGWKPLHLGFGLLVIGGLTLPWYAVMFERHGLAFLGHAPFFPYGTEPHRAWYLAPFLAVSLLVAGFFPWCALLPGALAHAAAWWRKPPRRGAAPLAPIARELSEERAAHWFIACGIAALTPILAYSAPPVTAVLPALPAAALLCGRLLDHVAEDAPRVADTVLRSTQVLSAMGTVVTLLLVLLASRLADLAPHLNLLAAAILVTAWLPFLAGLLGRVRVAAALMMGPVLVCAPLVGLRLMPAASGYVSAERPAAAIAAAAPASAPVVVLEEPPASFRMNVARGIVRADSLRGGLRSAAASDGYVYLAFRPGRERDARRLVAGVVAPASKDTLEVLVRQPSLIAARVRI